MKSFKQLSLLLIAFFVFLPSLIVSAQASEKQPAQVQEALTGDTVRLEGGKTLKYAGLSAPPLQSRLPLVKQYGAESLAFNKAMTEGKKVFIEWGSQIRDGRGNLLGYAFLEDGRSVNQAIIKEGHARASLTPPNMRYAGTFRKLELDARRNKRGLWKQEPENPFLNSEYIGEKNTKIFYLPDSPELDRIPQANLVKFRSRVEAKAAGYRACTTCSESDEVSY